MRVNLDEPKISLIIPVYNVEKFLRKALDSVVNQTFKDVEVIMVNDGSTDSSYDILKEYEKKYDNFIIVNKENGGLSDARNAGLNMAKGKYIAFMDSDDYLHHDFLKTLYNIAENNNADISYCDLKMYFPKMNLKLCIPTFPITKIYSKEKALKKLILDYNLHYFAWNKLCKRSIFEDNNIRYHDMYFEDVATSPKLFHNANKVAITKKNLYYYTQRSGSILRTMNVQKINDYIKSMGMIRNYLELKNDYSKYRKVFRHYANRVRLVNYYSITVMHIEAKNFSGMIDNIRTNNKLVDYFRSDTYKANGDMVEMPFLIKAPLKK